MYHIKSQAHSIILNRYLSFMEFKTLCDSLKTVPYGFILMQRKKNKKLFKLILSIQNIEFLYKSELEMGGLYCEYCDLERSKRLKIYDFRPSFDKLDEYIKSGIKMSWGALFKASDGATVDHYLPISLGGHLTSTNNLKVCCYKCNNKKKNKHPNEWNSEKNT